VGEDIQGKPGIAANVFNTIAEAGVNIRMISQGASEINISFVIREADVLRAVRHLHTHFFPEDLARDSEEDEQELTARSRANDGTSSLRIRRVPRTRLTADAREQ
jgi:aspartate kinase